MVSDSKRIDRYTSDLSQFSERKSFAFIQNSGRDASIAHLLVCSSPSAIAFLVIAIVVDSIKAKSWRTFTHVSNECLERIKPFFRHTDATTSVMSVLLVIGVGAAILSKCPSPVFLATPTAVLESSLVHQLAIQASATPGAAFSKILAFDGFIDTTITNASPVVTARVVSIDNSQASKALPGKINQFKVSLSHDASIRRCG